MQASLLSIRCGWRGRLKNSCRLFLRLVHTNQYSPYFQISRFICTDLHLAKTIYDVEKTLKTSYQFIKAVRGLRKKGRKNNRTSHHKGIITRAYITFQTIEEQSHEQVVCFKTVLEYLWYFMIDIIFQVIDTTVSAYCKSNHGYYSDCLLQVLLQVQSWLEVAQVE